MSDHNPIATIAQLYADRLSGSPGRTQLAQLARTTKHIPEPLLARVAELVEEIADPQFIGNDIHVHVIEIGYCDARYTDATAFVSALEKRLKRLRDDPVAASDARADFRERTAWWGVAIAKSSALARWPALALMNNNMEYSDG